jgi:hypothetical protein
MTTALSSGVSEEQIAEWEALVAPDTDVVREGLYSMVEEHGPLTPYELHGSLKTSAPHLLEFSQERLVGAIRELAERGEVFVVRSETGGPGEEILLDVHREPIVELVERGPLTDEEAVDWVLDYLVTYGKAEARKIAREIKEAEGVAAEHQVRVAREALQLAGLIDSSNATKQGRIILTMSGDVQDRLQELKTDEAGYRELIELALKKRDEPDLAVTEAVKEKFLQMCEANGEPVRQVDLTKFFGRDPLSLISGHRINIALEELERAGLVRRFESEKKMYVERLGSSNSEQE